MAVGHEIGVSARARVGYGEYPPRVGPVPRHGSFAMQPRPILRGDIFGLLDPDPGPSQTTPGRIGKAARRLQRIVERGERTPGAPQVMMLLAELAAVRDSDEPMEAWRRLHHVRQNLKAMALGESRRFPAKIIAERVLVLPQTRTADVLRVVPAGGERDVWFVLTREVVTLSTETILDNYAFPEPAQAEAEESEAEPVDGPTDGALGPPLVTPFEAAWRMFRFGERAFDIRALMRIVQPAPDYDTVHVASDGQRVAVVTTERVGIYDEEGQSAMASQLPFGRRAGEEATVAGIALDGDTLAMNIRQRPDAAFELALIDLRTRRGFPVGSTGMTPMALTLGPRQAYLFDDDRVVRLGLFAAEKEKRVRELGLGPWFAEYGPQPRMMACFGGDALWVSNGVKLLEIDPDLEFVRDELTLPDPIIDMTVNGRELRLIHHDRDTARVQIRTWEREE
jgi:hypothetical protein